MPEIQQNIPQLEKQAERQIEEQIGSVEMLHDKNVGFFKVLKTTGKILEGFFAVLLMTLSVLFMKSIFWMLNTWQNLSMEELVFHLQSPIEGTISDTIISYIVNCLLISLVVAVICTVIMIWVRKQKRKYHVTAIIMTGIAVLTSLLSFRYVWEQLDISSYNSNQNTYSGFIDDNYVDPSTVTLTFPEQKRNLIYIFLESVEMTYADEPNGGGFEENVIPELTQLSIENENFSGSQNLLDGGFALTGSTWTVAAMFAQGSGLPLKIPIEGNSMDTQTNFLPAVTTLGDILSDQGYNQTLLLGSDAVFGGRQLLYQTHGDFQICDYNYSIASGEIPSDYKVWWGYEDERLFEHAKTRLAELSEQSEPFNLTMLTVDTHFEDGYVCSLCSDTFGENQYANVMACSSKQVYDFVKWIQEQPFYDNTTIVISGDHPTMDSDFCDDVSIDYTRKVYTAYINAPIEPELDSYREYSTFDAFPTTLASLNVGIEGNRLGLGTNLFSSEQTLIERYGLEYENLELAKQSKLMDEITADVEDKTISQEEQSDSNDESDQTMDQNPESEATVEVSVEPYDYKTGKFTIQIHNVNAMDDIQAIRCAVWAKEDQSDIKWYEAALQDDGSYQTNVWAKDFAYVQQTYNIHVYAVYVNGESNLIATTIGVID